MFTTFSGSTKRPRQVNLSGRKTHAFGSPGTGAGSQAALDRAQQDRAQRQRERDTLKAAQTLQRLWRGYACRKVVSNQLRQEWDGIEGSAGGSSPPRPYDTEEEALAQLQRLLRFASPHNGSDTSRIQHYGLRQIATAQSLQITTRGPWPLAYLRLQRKMLRVLQDRLHRWSKTTGNTHEWDLDDDFLIILRFITQQIPAETSQNATQFYQTLVLLVIRRVMLPTPSNEKGALDEPLRILLDTTITPLTTVTGYTLKAYEAFGTTFMTIPILAADTAASKAVRDFFAASINYKLLANALATTFKKVPVQSHPDTRETSSRLILLACFVYFHRFAHNFKTPEADSAQKDFVTVISLLLNSLPINIIEGHGKRADQNDETASSSTSNVFLREQILSLINKEGIGNLLAGSIQSTDSSEDEKVDEARQLANYALALLRFFPRRGDEIRMWLYIGPSNGQNSSRKLPAIRYFWEASKRSLVFGTILKDSRAAIELLKHKAAVEKSSSSSLSWQPAEQEIERGAALADEWRVILVFLELYTFVLKVTDDEEFFSGGNEASSGQIRDNALPLPEVKELTTFLKNLGFTLYFNASDIISTDERDTSSTGLTFFNPKAIDVQPTKPAVEPSVGGVAGLSLDYVKGLVTGLLRMVYERDSRRKFLPSDHWLMTSRFDMSGFIPAVVQEEESRHKIEEEDAEDIDDDDDDDEEDELDDTPQLIGTSRTQQQRRQERLVREQRKASRRRYLQAVAPRLEILQNMPFFIPFTTRVQIFREFVHLDMTKRRGAIDPDAWRSRVMLRPDAPQQFARHAASIRREHEFEDAFRQFYPLGQGLKEPISITFVDQFDAQEAGIDGGGVTKEFLTSVTNRAFMPTDNIDMFIENDQHLLYPNPSAMEEQKEVLKQAGLRENSAEFRALVTDLSQRYEFLGRIIGKCLYEGILVDVNFAPFFLRKWALTGGTGSAPKETSYRPTLNDLRDLDEALYQGFHQLKTYPGNVEDFSLNFTVTDNIVVDHSTTPKKTKAITRELIPGGSDEAVTNQNRLVYITYMARHRLQNQPFVQTAAFLRGLGSMIQPSWLSMFNHSELQTLIGGTSSSIDIDDLRRNTLYGGTFVIGDDGLEHPSVQLFWKVLKDLSDGERRAVLKFVTSTPRAPLLGFGTLNPRFSIRDNGSDQQKLPTASTCVNLLKLPMYKDEATLKEKLLYSVFSGAGFDLS